MRSEVLTKGEGEEEEVLPKGCVVEQYLEKRWNRIHISRRSRVNVGLGCVAGCVWID